MQSSPYRQKGSVLYLVSIVLVAVLGGLLFGYDTAVISGAEKGLQAFFQHADDIDYTNALHGFTTSSALIGCMIGVYYEEILTVCRTGEWLSRQGIIYGPFNPVYGLGFLAFTVLLCRNLKRKWWLTYIYSCFIGGAAEVITSLISEYVFKVNAWDYSDKFLNIMGRTTIPFMLFWGLGGLIFVKFVYPGLSKLIELIPKRIGNLIMPTFLIFVLLSHVISYSALFRYGTRAEGQPASNAIEVVLDKYYDDDLMKQYYENSAHEKIGE